ncbi:FAD-dependent monooxygenase [Amorphoplanes nipponensis]|uniref:FAD-dependent oxidoreductase n=1 Tax=Actinoplanes nipponensis TaxID=135950 RepID=A0A919JRF0_9ACTN|nr:NAD(P)/FAD-dependent oxidoreductase [Actinoplanes nipponensis]GIE53970.1 FAD-dependent oxidoreductase [Actinoplanes nipponensis]
MRHVRTAVVIGGGIAGPVAALALHKAGIEATVFESHPTSADGVGGTIALAPNGLAALDIVGAGQPTVAVGRPAGRQVLRVGRGRRIDLPAPAGVGPLQVVRRGDLYRILRERAAAEGIRIEHGRRLVGAREEPDAVTAVFADGGEARADVLIGADGVHSIVRGLIDPAAPGPRYTGMLSFEGVSAAEVPEEPGTMTFAFGRRGYYLYWPAPGGGTTVGINLPHPRPLTIGQARAVPSEQWLRTLGEVYGEDTPGGDLVRRLAPADLQVNGALFSMPPVPHWHRGRMVLAGDAVHAPSNSSGQGASLAVESAVQLARCLRDLPVPAAFAAYERLRRARVEEVAARAATINRSKTPGPVAQALMPILMPLVTKLVLKPEKTLGPVQRYRIDWPAPATT